MNAKQQRESKRRYRVGGDGYLTSSEAAKRLGVAGATIRKYANDGLIDFVLTPGGQARYPEAEVERLAQLQQVRPPRKPKPKNPCAIGSCDRPATARGMCNAHHLRWHRTGSAGDREIRPQGKAERFWAKVHATGVCWWWEGAENGGGYGHFLGHPSRMAHRFAYEELIGPIPEGLQIDHLCRNRRCVNPDHLEPVTRSENVRRGRAGVLRPKGNAA